MIFFSLIDFKMQLPYPSFYCIFLTALGKERQGTKPHSPQTTELNMNGWENVFPKTSARMPSVPAHPMQRSGGSVPPVTDHWLRAGDRALAGGRHSALLTSDAFLGPHCSTHIIISQDCVLQWTSPEGKNHNIFLCPVLPNPYPHPTLGFHSLLPFSVQCPLITNQLFSTKAS